MKIVAVVVVTAAENISQILLWYDAELIVLVDFKANGKYISILSHIDVGKPTRCFFFVILYIYLL